MTNREMKDRINYQLSFVKFLEDRDLMRGFSSTKFRHTRGEYLNHLPIPIEQKKEIVVSFYSKVFGLSQGLNENYVVDVKAGAGNSCAGVNSESCKIEALIHADTSIQGFETIAHEIGHLLTGRNRVHLDLLKKIKNARNQDKENEARAIKEHDDSCARWGSCEFDAASEVEALTIEKIFILFLSKNEECRKVLDMYGFDIDSYLFEYEKEHENMVFDRIEKILETKQLLDKYGIKDYFENDKNFEDFLSKFQNDAEKQEFISAVEKISILNAKMEFRYVAGEALSKYWFDKFKTSNNSQISRELIDCFVNFWQGTDRFGIDDASALLCDGNSLNNVINVYLNQSLIQNQDSYSSM